MIAYRSVQCQRLFVHSHGLTNIAEREISGSGLPESIRFASFVPRGSVQRQCLLEIFQGFVVLAHKIADIAEIRESDSLAVRVADLVQDRKSLTVIFVRFLQLTHVIVDLADVAQDNRLNQPPSTRT